MLFAAKTAFRFEAWFEFHFTVFKNLPFSLSEMGLKLWGFYFIEILEYTSHDRPKVGAKSYCTLCVYRKFLPHF